MKKLWPLVAFIFSFAAPAGQVSYPNLYSSKTLLQGTGTTPFEAEADAISAMPQGYIRDKGNSPAIQCTGPDFPVEELKWSCALSKVMVTVPVVSEAEAAR
jgi:hypothetical protein